MGRNLQKPNLSVAACILVASIATQGALAAPPSPRAEPRLLPQLAAQTQHLDLRVPSHLAEFAQTSDEKNLGAFPSRRQSMNPQESVQLPALGSDTIHARPTIQDFVRRVRQEGLPVARIFEGKSALVHLGLNPKGKPGLWLVQKTR